MLVQKVDNKVATTTTEFDQLCWLCQECLIANVFNTWFQNAGEKPRQIQTLLAERVEPKI